MGFLSKTKTVVLVAVLGTLIGGAFAYLTRWSAYDKSVFRILATIQGATIGIVFSIFILGSQVSANKFTHLTLRQLSRSKMFFGMLIFYVTSVFIDVYFMQSGSVNLTFTSYTDSWNMSGGIAVGMASITLLSLLLARELLVSMTSPETIIDGITSGVDPDTFRSSDFPEHPVEELKPTRTPLLTVERILVRAEERGDEYTVQLAIHGMFRIVNESIDSSMTVMERIQRIENSDPDLDTLFQRWEKCIDILSSSPRSRKLQVVDCHTRIIEKLISEKYNDGAVDQIENLTRILSITLTEGYLEPRLINRFRYVTDAAIQKDQLSIVQDTENAIVSLVEKLTSSDASVPMNSELREVLVKCIQVNLESVSMVVQSDNYEESRRKSFASNSLENIGEILDRVTQVLGAKGDLGSMERNVCNEVIQIFGRSISNASSGPQVITQRMLVGAIELSLYADAKPRKLANSLDNEGTVPPDTKEAIRTLRERAETNSVEQEFRFIEYDGDELASYVTDLLSEISKN